MDKMDKKDTLVQPDDPKANRVNVDTEGNAYPNDKMCLTTSYVTTTPHAFVGVALSFVCIDACLLAVRLGCVLCSCVNNEIVYINTNSLSDVSDGDIPIPLSRTNLVGLPFLIPLIIAILALAAGTCTHPQCAPPVHTALLLIQLTNAVFSVVFAALCICWGWCSQCMAGCVAGWVCCQLPLMFLFIGRLATRHCATAALSHAPHPRPRTHIRHVLPHGYCVR